MKTQHKGPAADPTVPATEITLYGVTYKMALTNQALFDAEEALLAKGYQVSFLQWTWNPLASRPLANLFAMSLQHFHPDLDVDWVRYTLFNEQTTAEIYVAISTAREKNFPKPEKKDPPEPETESGEMNSGSVSSPTPE